MTGTDSWAPFFSWLLTFPVQRMINHGGGPSRECGPTTGIGKVRVEQCYSVQNSACRRLEKSTFALQCEIICKKNMSNAWSVTWITWCDSCYLNKYRGAGVSYLFVYGVLAYRLTLPTIHLRFIAIALDSCYEIAAAAAAAAVVVSTSYFVVVLYQI